MVEIVVTVLLAAIALNVLAIPLALAFPRKLPRFMADHPVLILSLTLTLFIIQLMAVFVTMFPR